MSAASNQSGPLGKRTEELIEAARQGCSEALGQLLQGLKLLLLAEANQRLPAELRAKVGPSDLVQQTFLEATRDFPKFLGHSEEELKAWLLGILNHNVANVCRDYFDTEKRKVEREVPIADLSNGKGCVGLPAASPSPSDAARRNEQAALQAELLKRGMSLLSPDEQEVIRLRHVEQRNHADVGRHFGITEEAARKKFARAIERLQAIIEKLQEADQQS